MEKGGEWMVKRQATKLTWHGMYEYDGVVLDEVVRGHDWHPVHVVGGPVSGNDSVHLLHRQVLQVQGCWVNFTQFEIIYLFTLCIDFTRGLGSGDSTLGLRSNRQPTAPTQQ